ncbi:MAG TPA: HipA N-terminal domain-containing protein [Chryseosolibacter sp.]|nr:HipA N-terminal domain-containing protein [Chryseosolibacter sp.]
MKDAIVYRNNQPAGRLILTDDGTYLFRYDDAYFLDPTKPAISLTLPKKKQEYESKFLFPFFFNMLSEGDNKKLQCRQLQIDENDNFSLLLATAESDTIGAVTVKKVVS